MNATKAPPMTEAKGIVERLHARAQTMNGARSVGAGDGHTYIPASYDRNAQADDIEAADLIQKLRAGSVGDLAAKIESITDNDEHSDYEKIRLILKHTRSAIECTPSDRHAGIAGLSEWSGWDKRNPPFSEAKHKDAVCYAVFGQAWSMEDAEVLIGFIDRTWLASAIRAAREVTK